MNRAIPILMEMKKVNNDPKNTDVVITGIVIGSLNMSEIEDNRLLPVLEKRESTGFEKIR